MFEFVLFKSEVTTQFSNTQLSSSKIKTDLVASLFIYTGKALSHLYSVVDNYNNNVCDLKVK